MGKTKTVISRPLDKVYLLELAVENSEIHKENEQRDNVGKQIYYLGTNNKHNSS